MTIFNQAVKSRENLVFGVATVTKLLRDGKLTNVFLASNYPVPATTQMEQIANLVEIKVEKVKHNNEEIGALCRKPFPISIVGVKK